MIDFLRLHEVGPAAELRFDFSERLNFITGDNGAGKSFVLDVIWWVMTRTWGEFPARPRPTRDEEARIQFRFAGVSKPVEYDCTYYARAGLWRGPLGRPANPGLVIYARVDGGFSVWDPARNYWTAETTNEVSYEASGEEAGYSRPRAYQFDTREVREGLREKAPPHRTFCNGLYADWVAWQREGNAEFEQLCAALRALSPSEDEPLIPGEPKRLRLDDVRDVPTLRMSYGLVKLPHASAAVQRICALAYLLVWTWREHLQASEILGAIPTTEITFLIDEIEAHLHPKWQRRILPSLLNVMRALRMEDRARVQLILTTHAPLMLASAEEVFQPEMDRLITLDLKDGEIVNHVVEWAKQGDAVNWLVSDAFGLTQARSRRAEEVIEAAEAFMRGEFDALPSHLRTKELIEQRLRDSLPGHDAFWPRWITSAGSERQG